MPRALPPWLNVAPSQFTEAAISGAQLGARAATEAAQLGLEAAKVAQQAQELQARRDAISAQFAAVNQRSSEASMENAIRNRQVALQEQVSRDSAAKMAANDNVWREGMSRYERAVNAGDDPEAAAFEILAPLQQAGFGGGKREIKSPGESRAAGSEFVPINVGGGRALSFNRRTGVTTPIEIPGQTSTPPIPNTETQRRNWFAGNQTMQGEEAAAIDKLSQPGADVVRILGEEHPTLLQNPPYSTKFSPLYNRAINDARKPEKATPPKESPPEEDLVQVIKADGTPTRIKKTDLDKALKSKKYTLP